MPDIKVQQAIEMSNRLKGVFEEILCRLGVFKGESNVVENITINIKLYSRMMNTKGDIIKEEFRTIDKDIEGKDLVVKFIYKENKLNDIDFDKLNEVLDNGIYGEGVLKNNSVNKIEDAKKIYKIRLDFNNKRVNYSINYA